MAHVFFPRLHVFPCFTTVAYFSALGTSVLGIVLCFPLVSLLTPVALFQPIFPRLTADTCFPALERQFQFFPRLTIHLTTVARMYSHARHHLLVLLRLKPVCVAIGSALYLYLVWLTKCD